MVMLSVVQSLYVNQSATEPCLKKTSNVPSSPKQPLGNLGNLQTHGMSKDQPDRYKAPLTLGLFFNSVVWLFAPWRLLLVKGPQQRSPWNTTGPTSDVRDRDAGTRDCVYTPSKSITKLYTPTVDVIVIT